jgi:hypothetical protein
MSIIFRNANNKKYKGKGKKPVVHNREQKGNWQYSHFQKIYNSTDQPRTIQGYGMEVGFDPSKIKDHMNPIEPKESIIQKKIDEGKKLTSSEKVIINNFDTKNKRKMDEDMLSIQKFGLNAEVSTPDGRHLKLIKTLEHVIKNSNSNMIALIYLKLKDSQFQLSAKIASEYAPLIKKMNDHVATLDIVELQMTTLHSHQPPLDQKGFTKLDNFQVEVINNIDNNISTIVAAPTSSGKSVISGYSVTKGCTLVIVPTDVLAWQMSSYMGQILDTSVPIITQSFQSIPKRDELVELVNRSKCLVGTADAILSFLPFIKVKWDWLIFDEIHMIGKPEGSSMEHIARLYSHVPFLALSATIGNVEQLKEWFQSLNVKPVKVVTCDKRFFNLQRHVYSSQTDTLERLHPLGMLSKSDLENGSILNKSIQPTPPDIWDFAIKLGSIIKLDDLSPSNYFSRNDRITLDMSNLYFKQLIEKMMKHYKGATIKKINSLFEGYQKVAVINESVDLMKLIFKLKENNKAPALIFQENSTSCMRLVRDLSKQIEEAQNNAHPELINERAKLAKKAKKVFKENEKKKVDDIPENKRIKMLLQDKGPLIETQEVVPMHEPHIDFILNKDQLFTEGLVEGWVTKLKKYFPNTGDEYHWLIVMLWRGIGVYVKGLPDPYLRLVQTLASAKKLAIVFSDTSLVFGVSMPFRTTVVLRDIHTEDTLDSMMYHQMAGRAGRRGLDKEGNVVFAGYSWDRIKNLSISSFPMVKGSDTMIYSIEAAKKISNSLKIDAQWDDLKVNFLHNSVTNEVSKTFYDDIQETMYEGGAWDFVTSDCINHNNMVWQLRHDTDCVTAPLIIPELTRIFSSSDPNKEKAQIDIALFLSHFINVKETTCTKFLLAPDTLNSQTSLERLKTISENIGIDIPDKIDSKVFNSIGMNRLIKLSSEKDIDSLRNDVMIFSDKVKHIQHYFFHTKQITMTRLLGKLLTRIWWIYHTSSPLMKSWDKSESNDVYNELVIDSDSEEEYESESDEDEEEEYEEEDEEAVAVANA